MNFRHPRWLAAAVLILGLAPWSRTAAAEPGDGVHSSDGGWKLTPAITLTGGYNTNLFRASSQETGSAIVDAPLAWIEPSISIANPGARKFRLTLDAGLQWEQYFGGSQTTPSGGTVNPVDQSGLSAHADASGEINPEGAVGLRIDERFMRANEPTYYAGNSTYNWIQNSAGATVGIHPGARILDVELGYHWGLYAYQTDSLSHLDRNEHRFDASAKWSFLPKTSLLAQADYTLVRWKDALNPGSRDDLNNDPLLNANASPLRVQGGLTGLLTRRIAIRALGGYGWSMHDAGPSFDGIIGTVALAYSFGRLDLHNRLELGYQRDFRNSTVGNFYSMHQVFANYEQGLMDRVVSLRLGGRFELRDYSQNLDGSQSAGDTGNSLNDELLIGEAGVVTNIDDWLIFDLAYNIRANFTNDQYSIPSVDPADPSLTILRKYTEHVITLSTTFQY